MASISPKVPGTSSTEMRYVRAANRREITP
jgi:hypothetical protein